MGPIRRPETSVTITAIGWVISQKKADLKYRVIRCVCEWMRHLFEVRNVMEATERKGRNRGGKNEELKRTKEAREEKRKGGSRK
jgi:pyocin large subunit-like protein